MSAVSSRSILSRCAHVSLAIWRPFTFRTDKWSKKGDLLFTIDRRPFQIVLAQTQASLAQAKANLAFAESDLARAHGLPIGSVITQQTFDQRTQAKRVAEAAVATQEAVVRQAALDLEFTELRAPVRGPHWRPPRVRWQSRHGWNGGKHQPACDYRID